MARKVVFPPPVREHKASGRARIRWQGADIYLGPWGSPEAAANYAREVARLSGGEAPPAAAGGTVAAAVASWLVGGGRRHDGTKEGRHYRAAIKMLLAAHPRTPSASFRARHLADVREGMILAGWSERYILSQVRRIRTVWRELEFAEVVPAGSAACLSTLPRIPPTDKRVKRLPRRSACTAETALAVAEKAPPDVRDIILVCLRSGMRPGEASRMRAEDIDRAGGEVWMYRPESHKNKWRDQDRVIALGPACVAVLLPRVEAAKPGEYLFRPKPPKGVRGGRAKNKRHPRFDKDVLQHAVRRAAKRAGVSFTLYMLRHLAKDTVTREHGLDAARSYLGQKSLTTTNAYGTAIDAKAAAEVARKCG